MVALANEYTPTVRKSDSRLIDTSGPLSKPSKFLRSAFQRFLKMNLRNEDALPSVQQPVNSLLLPSLCTSSRQNYSLTNASGLLSVGPMKFKSLLIFELPRGSEV